VKLAHSTQHLTNTAQALHSLRVKQKLEVSERKNNNMKPKVQNAERDEKREKTHPATVKQESSTCATAQEGTTTTEFQQQRVSEAERFTSLRRSCNETRCRDGSLTGRSCWGGEAAPCKQLRSRPRNRGAATPSPTARHARRRHPF